MIDASTLDSFLTTFSAFSRGFPNDVVWPDFSLAAELFPPRNPPPRNYLKLMEDYWFTEGNYVTRRFVFNSLSISRIRSMVPIKLSRVKALSCFIWQRVMVASGVMSSVTGAPKISILVEAVNLRKVTDPPLSQGLVGNVVWWAVAIASSNSEMAELGSLVSEAIELFRSDDVKLTQGESGYELMTGYCQILRDLQSVEGEELDIMAFTSWCGFGFSGHDFGRRLIPDLDVVLPLRLCSHSFDEAAILNTVCFNFVGFDFISSSISAAAEQRCQIRCERMGEERALITRSVSWWKRGRAALLQDWEVERSLRVWKMGMWGTENVDCGFSIK
ncbi:Vinorine synthase [Linum perenne]